MQKILLIAVVMLSHFASFSQTIFKEDFDNIPGPTGGGPGTYKFPPGWLLRNVDNRTPDAQVAYVNDAWERREDFNFNVVDSTAFSTSWYTAPGVANDWMWTPLIGPLPPNSRLKWNAVTYDPAFQDRYEVRVMTSASGPPTGGTGVIGNQETNSTVIFSTAAENSAWTTREVNLSAYAGQSIYIGFRNNSDDKFLLLIDDVEVYVSNNYDAAMVSIDTITEYTRIPLSQASPLPLGGTIRNNGIQPLTNVQLSARVYDEANSVVFSGTSNALPSLAPGATAHLAVPTGFTPVQTGNYRVEFTPVASENLDAQQDDTLTDYVVITDTLYARDNGNLTGSLGIGAGTTGYLGQEFLIQNDDILTSVSIRYASFGENTSTGIAIWDYLGGKPNTILYQSPIVQMPASSDITVTYQIPPLNVSAGQVIVITAVEIDSTLAVGLASEKFTTGTTWVKWAGNPLGDWANNEDYGASFARSYMIRANFVDCTEFPEISATPVSQELCSGESATEVTFSSSIPGTVNYWTNNNPSIGLPASGTGDIPSFVATNSSGLPVTATITVIPVADGCTGAPVTVTITVNSSPVFDVTPLEQSICSGEEIVPIEISLSPAGSFIWTRDNVTEVTGIAASGSGDISGTLTNTTGQPVTVDFTITPTGYACNGSPIVASVSVQLVNTVDPIGNDTVCAGTVVSETVITGSDPMATYTWVNDNPAIGLAAGGSGNIPSFVAANTGTLPLTANITITPSGGGVSDIPAPELLYYNFEQPGTTIDNLASNPPPGTATASLLGGLSIGTANLCDQSLIGSGASSTTDFVNTNWETNLPGSWTISFKTSDFGSTSELFYIFGDINAGSFRCFTNGVAGTNNWMLRGTGINDVYLNGGATVEPHTCTFVYNQADNNIYAYLDGQLVSTVAQATPAINGSGPFKVMGYSSNAGAPEGGKLDEFRVYSRALSSTEVEALAGCPVYGCGSEPFTYTITVYPGTEVSVDPLSQEICSETAITPIAISSSTPGYVSTWTRGNVVNVTGVSESGSGDISGTLVNETFTAQTVNFSITTSNGHCSFESGASVTVLPIDTIAAVPDITVCAGETVPSVIFSGSSPDLEYSWTNDNTSIGLGAGGTGDIPSFIAVNSSSAPVTANITVLAEAESEVQNNALQFDGIDDQVVFALPSLFDDITGNDFTVEAYVYPIGNVFSRIFFAQKDPSNFVSVSTGNGNNIYFYVIRGGVTYSRSTSASLPLNQWTHVAARWIAATQTVEILFNGVLQSASSGGSSSSGTNEIMCLGTRPDGAQYFSGILDEVRLWNTARTNTEIVENLGHSVPPDAPGLAAYYKLDEGTGSVAADSSPNSNNGTLINNPTWIVPSTAPLISTGESCQIIPKTFTITVNPIPDAVATPATQTICSGNAITTIALSGAVSGTTYTWTRNNTASVTGIAASGSGNISGTLTNTTSSSVTVTFTITPTANGCSGTPVTATVLVNPTPTAVATPALQSICTGSAITTIVLSGGVAGTTYTWTRDNTGSVTGIPASGSGNISGSLTNTTTAPVTVTFTITPTANGCTGAPVTATVIVNPVPNAVATPAAQTICSGDAITTIVLSGVVSGTTYTWTRNNTASVTGIPAAGSGNIAGWMTNNTSSPVTVTFTITPSANGCSGTPVTATVLVNPSPQGTISIDPNPACVGSTVSLSASGGISYAWSGPHGWSSVLQSPSVYIDDHLWAGIYTVTITANGGCQSILSDTLQVFYPPVVSITYKEGAACAGSDLRLYGSGAGTYAWSGPNGWSSTERDPLIEDVTTAHSGTYTLTVTAANGCSATASVDITIHVPQPVTASPAVTHACEGNTVQLFAQGSGTFFQWSGPATYYSTQQNPVIHNIPIHLSGIYTVRMIDENGCASSDEAEVLVYDQISAKAVASPDTVCEGQSVQLYAEGGSSYLWNGPNGFFSTDPDPRIDNVTLQHEGTYYVYIYNEGGCFGYAEVRITVRPSARGFAYASPNPVNEGQNVQLFASDGVAYQWSGPNGFNSTLQNPIITRVSRSMAGVYIVTITNENGCPTVVRIVLKVSYKNNGGNGSFSEDDGLNTRSEETGRVYPNPTNDYLYFETPSTQSIEYTIYDVTGKIHTQGTSQNSYISTGQMPSGVYLIRWKPQDLQFWNQNTFVKIR